MTRTSGTPDEESLVEACLACDDRAIRQLVAAHRPAIASLAWARLGADDVDDVCQEVYLRVFTRLGRFEHRSRLGTWIYRVALNVIRNRQRTARRRRFDAHVSFDEVSARDRVTSLADPATPASLAEAKEQAWRVRRAIRRLPPVQRSALTMWTYADSSHAAIARSIGLSVPDVKRTLRTARKGVRLDIERGPVRSGPADLS